MPDNQEVEREHCNRCLGWTNQSIAHTLNTSWSEVVDEEYGAYIHGGDTWQLLRCLGCDTVRLRHRYWFSEDTDERGQPTSHTEFFPPTVKRQLPIWRRQFIPYSAHLRKFDGLMDEIYAALAQGSHRLATMGVRALVERLMIDQVGDKGTFDKNMNAFFSAGHVAPNQQGMFKDTLIEAGHAAMHRDFEPSADTVNTLLDIVEGVMHNVYYTPMLAAEAKKTIPPRS